jgi:hypothetical protein
MQPAQKQGEEELVRKAVLQHALRELMLLKCRIQEHACPLNVKGATDFREQPCFPVGYLGAPYGLRSPVFSPVQDPTIRTRRAPTTSCSTMTPPRFDTLGLDIVCPDCGAEMTSDPNTLPLAEAPCGAMLECGQCGAITSWRWTLEPFDLKQVPNEWGGTIECD